MKKKYIGILLIVFGCVIISSAIFMKYEGAIKQKKMIADFEKAISNSEKDEKITSDISDNIKGVSKSNSNTTSKSGTSSNSYNYKNTVGILKIPKIDLKVAVGEGIDMKTLKYAAGHFPDSPYPGTEGNCAIAGHRSYTYNQFFNRLDEVDDGDIIIMQTKDGEFKYEVYKKFVVLPEEVSVLNDTEDAELTLITCTPIRAATHRLIIKAVLVE
ncbi:class D sortase [Metaclostridioides mangenotii]|uniref:class D sortase n=1 Tax=Metaclostridioides mangenotii TaxID=1540 RepID=UPI0028E658CC|nr:class D sortase [Clostridioides mangenotii]